MTGSRGRTATTNVWLPTALTSLELFAVERVVNDGLPLVLDVQHVEAPGHLRPGVGQQQPHTSRTVRLPRCAIKLMSPDAYIYILLFGCVHVHVSTGGTSLMVCIISMLVIVTWSCSRCMCCTVRDWIASDLCTSSHPILPAATALALTGQHTCTLCPPLLVSCAANCRRLNPPESSHHPIQPAA